MLTVENSSGAITHIFGGSAYISGSDQPGEIDVAESAAIKALDGEVGYLRDRIFAVLEKKGEWCPEDIEAYTTAIREFYPDGVDHARRERVVAYGMNAYTFATKAARMNHPEAIAPLLACGVNVHAPDRTGSTPRQTAERLGGREEFLAALPDEDTGPDYTAYTSSGEAAPQHP